MFRHADVRGWRSFMVRSFSESLIGCGRSSNMFVV